ncbi:hypothetical protein HK100_001090 [Physocladia obscura]|uniref:Methyltransferase domain-containing protein n=1 Tax=Physocladia obscura TaxID=109957 RepID=A0AAD5SXH9_9FUNG|nr:hypothetical protein HK100_001090 [Physocladia obscura]
MGSQQSAIIKNTLSVKETAKSHPDSADAHNAASANNQQSDAVKRNVLNPQTPKSPIGTSKKYELKAAHVNTLVAKTWNPNDPKSWEPEMREYHSLPNSDYLLPNDAAEQDRLEMQHYIFRAAFDGDIVCPTVRKLISTSALKILDVGCAKGFWLKKVKQDNQLIECHGVDISKTLVENSSSEADGLFLRFGNVLETLPYEDNTFDFTHQRFLVAGMPRDKFPDALKELIRVTKSGGWIELVECDAVIYNAGPYSQTLTTALFDGYHRRGLDCYAAANLPFYVKQVAGNVENQEDKVLHLSMGWGSKMGILFGADWKSGVLGLEDWMHKTMGLSREDYRQLVQGCYSEWPEQKSFAQIRALYFQFLIENGDWVRVGVRCVGAGGAHGVGGAAWACGAASGGGSGGGGALGAGVGARHVCRSTERGVAGDDPRGPAAERPGLAVRLAAEQARYLLWWAFSLGLVLALSLYPQSHQPHLSTRIVINSPSNSSVDFLRVAVTALHNAPLGCSRKQTHLRLFAANQQILYRQTGSESLSDDKSYLVASAASLPHHAFFQLSPADDFDDKSFLLSTHFDTAILKVGVHCDYFPANLIFGKELYLIDLSQRGI